MLPTRTVVGHLLRPDGSVGTGKVVFQLDEFLLDTIDDIIVVRQPVSVSLDAEGRFAITLAVTAADQLADDTTYRIWFEMDGQEPVDAHAELVEGDDPIDILDLLEGAI